MSGHGRQRAPQDHIDGFGRSGTHRLSLLGRDLSGMLGKVVNRGRQTSLSSIMKRLDCICIAEVVAGASELQLEVRRSKLRQSKAIASYRTPRTRVWSAQACLRLDSRQLAAANFLTS